jgi:RND family efflux transporter MFP subunit
MKIAALPSLFILAVALSLASGCGQPKPRSTSESAQPARVVRVVAVAEELLPRWARVPGEVRAADRARLAARVSGAVAELAVTLGQTVRAGDSLARLEAPELAARLDQARTGLAQAQREWTRDRELLAKGASTEDAVRLGEERVRAAQAGLAEAEALFAQTEIRAPFEGRVAARQVNRGDLVFPGQPLLTLDRGAAREVVIPMPVSLAAGLAPGATLKVSARGQTQKARITEIAAAANAATRTVECVLALDADAPWQPGESVVAAVPAETALRLLVPEAARRSFGQVDHVFVVSETRAQIRLVKVGQAHGGRLEILSGLAKGESVVVSADGPLLDAARVEVSP